MHNEPADDSENVLLGERLAAETEGRNPATQIKVSGRQFTIPGILSTGGRRSDQIVAPLAVAQQYSRQTRRGTPCLRQRNDQAPGCAFPHRDPKTMTPPQVYDRWYCSPYVESIAYQLQEVIPHSHAEQIRQVAQNEGTVLSRIKGTHAADHVRRSFSCRRSPFPPPWPRPFIERRVEVGLMKALGAGHLQWSPPLFFAEALAARAHRRHCRGSSAGAPAGAPDRPLHFQLATLYRARCYFPIILAIAVFVTFAGSAADDSPRCKV